MRLFVVSAKDFVRKLMDSNPDKRYTCKQALQDPWYKCRFLLYDFKQGRDKLGIKLSRFASF